MRGGFDLWGNGGGDDVLITDNVTALEAAFFMAEHELSFDCEDGWGYFLVKPSRTWRCRERGNVNPSDIASTRIPNLHFNDRFWVCDQDGEIRKRKHCTQCSLLSVSQILTKRLDDAELLRIEEERIID